MGDFIGEKGHTTCHYACDCREEMFRAQLAERDAVIRQMSKSMANASRSLSQARSLGVTEVATGPVIKLLNACLASPAVAKVLKERK